MEKHSMHKNTTLQVHSKLAYSIRELSKLTGICERKIHYEIKNGNLKKKKRLYFHVYLKFLFDCYFYVFTDDFYGTED